jgi:hypothetical protein
LHCSDIGGNGKEIIDMLVTEALRPAQITAIRNLDVSLADQPPRALIQITSGGGKTFTACNFAYWLQSAEEQIRQRAPNSTKCAGASRAMTWRTGCSTESEILASRTRISRLIARKKNGTVCPTRIRWAGDVPVLIINQLVNEPASTTRLVRRER